MGISKTFSLLGNVINEGLNEQNAVHNECIRRFVLLLISRISFTHSFT